MKKISSVAWDEIWAECVICHTDFRIDKKAPVHVCVPRHKRPMRGGKRD